MYSTYQLLSGDRPIGYREASTAQAALFDYVRSLGCRDEEIMKLGPDAISWRGAVFRAVRIPQDVNESEAPVAHGGATPSRR